MNDIYRVPDSDVIKYGMLKNNGENCMDTMGHQLNEGVGVFNCHGQGGNQVCSVDIWLNHFYFFALRSDFLFKFL